MLVTLLIYWRREIDKRAVLRKPHTKVTGKQWSNDQKKSVSCGWQKKEGRGALTSQYCAFFLIYHAETLPVFFREILSSKSNGFMYNIQARNPTLSYVSLEYPFFAKQSIIELWPCCLR